MADIGGNTWNFQILPADNLMAFLGGYEETEDEANEETFSEELNQPEENVFGDIDVTDETEIFGDIEIE